MPFLDVMHAYFRGERIESLHFIVPIGIAMVAFAAVTLRAERGGFAWGLAVPLVLFGERRARPYTEALEVLAAEWAPR
jgi:hypothetical protein